MRATTLLVFGIAAASAVLAAESTRPRGVGPEFSKFYRNSKQFSCISDPSTILDISQLNDDYCDCPDGSDEPGTSACAFLSPLSPASPDKARSNVTLALPGFYCKNKGHQPSYVPFTYVNDGVCDHELCCDGSDEWAGVGGTRCEDKCKEIGKAWRKLDDARKTALGAAMKKRRELVIEAQRLRKEVEYRITTLGAEIEGQELKVKQLEKDMVDVEKRDSLKVVKGGKGKRVNVLAGLAKQRIEELRFKLMDVKAERDARASQVMELEDILSKFKEERNPNFNDEGVKRAVQRWEDYAAHQPAPDASIESQAIEEDLEEILLPDSAENGIKWEEWEGDDEDDNDVEAIYQFTAYLPTPVRHWLDEQLSSLRKILVENGILASSPHTTAGESPALTAARNTFSVAQTDLNNLRNDLQSQREDIDAGTARYGTSEIMRALKGTCTSIDSGEYTYELCILDRLTQKSKKGGSDTSLGSFTGLQEVDTDEEVPADGKGLGRGRRLAMKYENGQTCWNGPARSALVVMGCAEKVEIWRVREEEKCVYRVEMGSPAGCEAGEEKKGRSSERDEL